MSIFEKFDQKKQFKRKGIFTFLPNFALATIVSYDMNNLRTYLGVCADWNCGIREGFDKFTKEIENKFVLMYHEYLLFKESYMSSQQIEFCDKKGLRVDRAICCEIINHKHMLNKVLKFSFTFRYYGEKRRFRYEFKIDVVKRNPRLIWMHYDQDNSCSYIQTISQFCPGDSLEFAITLSSLKGFVDIASIQWNQPEFFDIPDVNTLTYNKDYVKVSKVDRAVKIYADINRVCELEDTVVEWYDHKFYQHKNELIDFSFIHEMFEITSIEYSGVDNPVVRLQLKAIKEGKTLKSHN